MDVIQAALDAGAKAASVKEYSSFDLNNKASWETYTRHIRHAMDQVISEDDDLRSFTDTAEAQRAAIAKEDGFQIGVISKSENRVIASRFLKFETIDFKL